MSSKVEVIQIYRGARETPTPPTGTTEKFIGQIGSNLTFYIGTDANGHATYCSAYGIIGLLSLRLGDPRVNTVKTIFSRLTHFMEVRALADPNYPVPDFDQPFIVPTEVQEKVNNGLMEHHKLGTKVILAYDSFVKGFSNLLVNQGIPELAELIRSSEEEISP